jgi:hypothetical protein
MSAGSFPAGVGPAGHAPVAPRTNREPVRRVAAAFFDPATRENPTDARGRVIPVHPVDQAVALALSFERGKLASTPDVGHGLRKLPRANDAVFASMARDDVARALATLVGRGDVTLLGVELAPTSPGQKARAAIVRYRNNRLPAGVKNEPVKVEY